MATKTGFRAGATPVLLAILCLAFLTAPAQAQPAGCSDGIIHDDGSFETSYGYDAKSPRGTLVMRVDPAGPGRLESACVCWLRSGADDEVRFDLEVWAADGPGGSPGTLLGRLPGLTATAVPETPRFYRYDLSSLGIEVDGPVYVGPSWSPGGEPGLYVCADESAAASQPGYGENGSTAGQAPASQLGSSGFFPDYRHLGVRAKFAGDSTGGTGRCTPGETTMCLSGGRFQVTATWRTKQGAEGQARTVRLTDDSGYLWFFDAANVETVIKVLDGCELNDRFWVFAGGLTDVQVEVSILDTVSGTRKVYMNPMGRPFQPIQDTGAFATCR